VNEPTELVLAEREAKVARETLAGTLATLQTRLQPRALLQEAVLQLRDTSLRLTQKSLAAANQHPGRVALIVAGLTAILLAPLFKRLINRRKLKKSTLPDTLPKSTAPHER